MFRCITQLKALVIDIDDIHEDFDVWTWAVERYQCFFITSNPDTADMLARKYGNNYIFLLKKYQKLFAPSKATHEIVLSKLGVKTTELVYVTGNKGFIDNAMCFLCGTIWITNRQLTYADVGTAPDLICRRVESLKNRLEETTQGFFGETTFSKKQNITGHIVPVVFTVDDTEIHMWMLGRYFGYGHYMSQLHPYSTAIYLNKKEGKANSIFNEHFAKLYSIAVKRIMKSNTVDAVCAVPVRPGIINRFESILNYIAENCGIKNIDKNFSCIKNYPTQKNLSKAARQENVQNVFEYDGDLTGKNVVLIDDIVTTGATLRECINELKWCGVQQVFVIVLGVNQQNREYWTSAKAQVSCPNCGEAMHLLVNSNNKNFFYSCYQCGKTLNFENGMEILHKQVNAEFENIQKENPSYSSFFTS